MRARLAIAISGQACELREVVLRDKPEALRLASPKATVPVLVLEDGAVIDQSLEIMIWALGRNDPEQWLGSTPAALQDMLTLVAQCDGPFKQHLDRYKYPNRHGLADGMADRALGAEFLQLLQDKLVTNGFLAGPQRQLADMAIAPFVRQFAHTDPGWFAAQNWPELQAWLQQFEDSALYASVMDKYPQWEPGQAVVQFPVSG
jgi:glutathione S-transferase